MSRTKEMIGVSIDIEIHNKLELIAVAQKFALNNPKASVSGIVHQALVEYLDNHKDEVNTIMNEYKKRGWIV